MLKRTENESIVDYVIRAETAATALRNADEAVSDALLIAMVLKGLPSNYKLNILGDRCTTRRENDVYRV